MTMTSSPFQRISASGAAGAPGGRPASRTFWLQVLLLIILMLAVQAGALYIMGRAPTFRDGPFKLWHGIVLSSENSQHLTDWYTFSHVVHGFLFYFITWLVMPRASIWTRLAIAVFAEAAWEIAENTPMIIERYRSATISLGYNGDSIVNSLGDTAAMVVGFVIAAMLPAWATLGLAIALEVGLALIIRDNLILNIIMLVHPVEAIKVWQQGLGSGP